jgi:hypothetical protein
MKAKYNMIIIIVGNSVAYIRQIGNNKVKLLTEYENRTQKVLLYYTRHIDAWEKV